MYAWQYQNMQAENERAEKAWREKQKLEEYNLELEEAWVDAGEPGRMWRIRSIKQIPKGWKPGDPVKPPPGFNKHLSEKSYKAALAAVRPSQKGRDRLAPQLHNKPVKHMIRGKPLKKRKPTTRSKKFTLPPGVTFRNAKAPKASLFQPKGLPAPAAALPKIQPKALPKYRAAKAAKAKTPRKKAAPKPPKCVNGVVHVKAYTRKCGTKKKATSQAGKGVGSKLKTAAKIAGAAALAGLAYHNRHIPANAAITAVFNRKVLKQPWGETLKNVGTNAYKGLQIPGIKQNTLPKFGGGRRRRAASRK
jgi:hypothetical protein